MENESAQPQTSKLTVILLIAILVLGGVLGTLLLLGYPKDSTDESSAPADGLSVVAEVDNSAINSTESTDTSATTTMDMAANPTETTTYTLAQVAEKNMKTSCWTVIEGGVYDITSYIPNHPGGESEIMQICGKDGTALFTGKEANGGPHSNGARNFLSGLKIGNLAQ